LQTQQVVTAAQALVEEVKALVSFSACIRVQADGHAVFGPAGQQSTMDIWMQWQLSLTVVQPEPDRSRVHADQHHDE
jgi:hypothetical protein